MLERIQSQRSLSNGATPTYDKNIITFLKKCMKHQLCVQRIQLFSKNYQHSWFSISLNMVAFSLEKTIKLIDVKEFLQEQKSDDSLLI